MRGHNRQGFILSIPKFVPSLVQILYIVRRFEGQTQQCIDLLLFVADLVLKLLK